MTRRLTVKALAAELERLLQRAFPIVQVEGELAQIQRPQSGHAYLQLREADAVLHAVVWRADWNARAVDPKVGDRIVLSGRLGAHAAQSRFQLYATRIEAAGKGEHERRLQEIRARLERDGLLDPRRKRPLPTFPRVVGVATALHGAALQDFLRVSGERWPAARILVSACVVQGEEGPSSVIRALELLFDDGRAEVVVVTRGGGARADLGAFDDEQLARWIATAPVPVVSAVGHEIDTTIADLVADRVAPTPSAGALAVLPDRRAFALRIDDAAERARRRVERLLADRRRRLVELEGRLAHPARRLAVHAERHQRLAHRLRAAVDLRLERARTRLRTLEARLRALSPLAVLDRGYAVVRKDGAVVREPGAVAAGDPLEIRVAGGTFGATARG